MITPWIRKNAVSLTVAAIAVAGIVLRLVGVIYNLYDLHIDEITYAHFAQTIDQGKLPLLANGQPFFLHPPGYFALLAIWRALVWHGHDLFTQFKVLRGLNVLLSGITIWLMFLLTKVVTRSNRLGLLAAVLFTVDPFIIRQNTRGLMETETMMWLLYGMWLLFRHMDWNRSSRMWAYIGLIFGLAMVSKDVAGTFLVLTLGIMWLRKVGPALKNLRYFIPTALAPYAVWVAIVAVNKDLGQFFSQKTVGVQRFLGLVQVTGFNSTDSPSKTGTLLQTLTHYGSSYAIMGLGVAGACLLLFSKDVNRRRWGSVGAASVLLLGYLYVGGTFEEQYLYYLLIPAIITIVAAIPELFDRISERFHAILGRVVALSSVALILYGIVAYSIAIATPDNGWTKTAQWLDANAPYGSSINVFGQGQFILYGHEFDLTSWSTVEQLEAHHVRYAVISQKLSTSGYTPLAVGQVAKVYQVGKIVFAYHSRDSGKFDIVELPDTIAPPKPVVPAVASTATTQASPSQLPDSGPIGASTPLGSASMAAAGVAYINSRRKRRSKEQAF